jgi:para-nitrobenzyl esterase
MSTDRSRRNCRPDTRAGISAGAKTHRITLRMRRASMIFIAALVLPGRVADAQAPALSAPKVITASGALAGIYSGPGWSVVAFLGIPYAAPPTGNRRWQPPQPASNWSGIRYAKQFSPSCQQFPSPWWPEMAGRERLETSEDCLYLNIWTTPLPVSTQRPVMVWIHGGGNVEGSSQVPPLAPALARKGVVVVSIEYRLGVFGFLAHPALTAESPHHSSGNYGLLDQIAALEWVQHNIAAFGGDRNAVTIFGESSGAEDVCHLLASPLGAGLFHNAILESGVCSDSVYSDLTKPLDYYGNHGPGELLGVRLSSALGIANDTNALASLRALAPDTLLEAAHNLKSADFGVVVDGWVVPDQPAIIFEKRRQARVPVLLGSNANETTVFGKPSPLATTDSHPKNIAQYRQWLANEFREFASDVWKVYPATSNAEVESVFLRMQTDYDFGFGSYALAKAMSDEGQPAYLYYFTYVGRDPFAVLGAFHSEELMFIGDTYWKSWAPNSDDEKLSEIMEDYWVRFAKSSNPNRRGLPEWPPYKNKSGRCMELGREVKSRSIPHKNGYAVFERILESRLTEIDPSARRSTETDSQNKAGRTPPQTAHW